MDDPKDSDYELDDNDLDDNMSNNDEDTALRRSKRIDLIFHRSEIRLQYSYSLIL